MYRCKIDFNPLTAFNLTSTIGPPVIIARDLIVFGTDVD